MYANSPAVESAQDGPHRRLSEVVGRHRANAWRQPIANHSRVAWQALKAWMQPRSGMPLILDSGCGTGASSIALAAANPQSVVVGVDQSLERLSRQGELRGGLLPFAENAALLRAPLQDLWRLLLADGVSLQRHLIWYPNPWPKPEHLQRRWHAHAVFPTLLALGGDIELRSNWRIYVDEFAQALALHGWDSATTPIEVGDNPATPFERKYRDSGHPLWRLAARAVVERLVDDSHEAPGVQGPSGMRRLAGALDRER